MIYGPDASFICDANVHEIVCNCASNYTRVSGNIVSRSQTLFFVLYWVRRRMSGYARLVSLPFLCACQNFFNRRTKGSATHFTD